MSRNIVQSLKYKTQAPGIDAKAIEAVLENAYLSRRRPGGFTKKKTFSPSSIGYNHGTCPRYWYLAFTGGDFVETTDALGVANMAYGVDAHTRIQSLFKEAGILVDEEVEIKLADPPIRGFLDVLVRWEGEVVVGEIKTTRQESFIFRQTTMKPMATHLIQVLIYMKATNKKNGFVIYENKNDQTFLVIPVEWNGKHEALLEEVFEWLRTVYKTYEAEELPMRPFRKQDGKVCMACPLNKVCWEDNPEGTVKISKMEVPTV